MKITKTTAWACVAACCLLSGCHKQQGDTKNEASNKAESKGPADEVTLSPQAQAEQKIEVAPVELGTAAATQRAKGRIAFPDNATWRVGVLAEGRIEKVYFNLGDNVKKGQVLAHMHSHDVHEARAAYANAVAERSRLQAAEALAQKNYDRSQRLYALKAESVSQTETAKQELVNAQSATREADNIVRREATHLVETLGLRADAPNDSSDDTPGATISTSADAFVIGDLSRLWMLASVDTATLSKLNVGQTATVTLPDVPEANYTGKITNLGQEFDPVTRLMQVRIEIRNPDNRLRPEMLASAEFTTGDGIPTVLVPQEAIQQVNGEDVVFVRMASDRFRVQAVKMGENVHGKVRILQGLRPGEQVITHGSFIAKSQLLKSSIGD